jgi:hypothetical protein
MPAFDTWKPMIDAMDESMSASMTRLCNADRPGSTRLPRFARSSARTEGALRDASQRHDRQVLSAAAALDDELNHDARSSSNERMRSGARRSSRRTEWPVLAESTSRLVETLSFRFP